MGALIGSAQPREAPTPTIVGLWDRGGTAGTAFLSPETGPGMPSGSEADNSAEISAVGSKKQMAANEKKNKISVPKRAEARPARRPKGGGGAEKAGRSGPARQQGSE